MNPFKILIFCTIISFNINAQITTGNVTGTVKMQFKPVVGATIIIREITNGSQLVTISNQLGQYYFYNLLPSNQYQIQFQASYADTLIIQLVEVKLGSTIQLDAALTPSINVLQPVTVVAKATNADVEKNKHFSIFSSIIDEMVISSRNYLSMLKYFQTANTGATGAISFSGQNNRYNSLYIDGALQNDVFGLSPTGTYGGLTESAPVSIEIIEQLQLQLTPYDASLGGYTGAALNMTTKMGKNNPYTSIYRYSGLQKGIFNNTGIVLSGPIKENRFFYFLNADYTREERKEEYDLLNYKGDTKNENQFRNFIGSVKTNFNYNPGNIQSFYERASSKMAMRLDYLLSKKHRINLSIRKNFSSKASAGINSSTLLFLSNNGKRSESSLFSGSLELSSNINSYTFNQLILSYSKSTDEMMFLGNSFPSVSILDGEGIIFLGSNEDAQESNTQQNNWNLRNKISYHKGKKIFNAGMELEWNKIKNQFLQNKFGAYLYYSIGDFLNNKKPGAYEINNPVGSTAVLANNFKTAIFVNGHWSIGKNMTIHAGIRMSLQQLIGNPQKDSITNNIVAPIIASYYPEITFSYGTNPFIIPNISPRLSCLFQLPKHNINIEIGTGLFGGRMPIAWMSGIYYNNGLNYTYYEANGEALKKIRFEQNIHKQWKPQQFGNSGNKGVLNLMVPKISMPSVWRSSFELRKQLKEKWLIQFDAMYYYNVDEIAFSNLNLLPPKDSLQGPDQRPIYTALNKARIPILIDSSNPYEQIILMGNNVSQHGFGYRFGLKIKSTWQHAHFSVQYSFGESYSVFDGNYSVLLNQWKLNEHVYGRNNLRISRADFSPGHLIQFWTKRDWFVGKKRHKAFISIGYIGKSGNSFSYVYGGKNISRDEPSTTGYDLMYVPTTKELNEQLFIPLETNNTYYTANQQKEALAFFIETDPYLNKIRGSYAERNGSRVPFNHQVDLKISYAASFNISRRKYGLNISLDIINLGNLIHAQWGQNWSFPGNRFRLVNFEGFLSPNQYIPQFTFNPTMVKHQNKSVFQKNNSSFGAEWQIQLGIRINFY